MDDARPDVRGAGGAGFTDYRFELLGQIREPGKDRRDAHTDVDSGFGEAPDRGKPASRWRGSGLCCPPDAIVESRDRDVDARSDPRRSFLKDVDVADDQRAARDYRERRRRPCELDDTRSCEPEASLGRLIWVGCRSEGDLLALPRRSAELAT